MSLPFAIKLWAINYFLVYYAFVSLYLSLSGRHCLLFHPFRFMLRYSNDDQICNPETEEAKRMMKCYADFVHR